MPVDRLESARPSRLTAYADGSLAPARSFLNSAAPLDVWAMGGAMGRVDATTTAFGRRDAPFLVGIEANWDGSADDAANIAWSRAVYDDLRPF